jgi:hypothetical protein
LGYSGIAKKFPPNTKVIVYITAENGLNYILDRRMGDLMSSEVTAL